ncbi:MAG: sulfurtransferase [Chloroflexi bacterium]|nr:sulfurtransferase [Chloroflexota bacterium]
MSYAHPEYLVETEWVANHLTDPTIRIIESDEDALLYAMGHIEGAVQVDWFSTLQHPLRRDFMTREQFEEMCSKFGITNNTIVIFYGDKSNWFACYALWLFQYYGHNNVKIMNGGRIKWEQEKRPLVKDVPSYARTTYRAKEADKSIRAFRDDIFQQIEKKKPMVDVRSPKEYTGEMLHMPNYPQEGATRGGHIPGAVSIPWSQAVNEADATFKTPEELAALYKGKNIKADGEIIAYCRIGERSSLTWFVLKYLLGYPNVKNYDGSWTEWGNLVDAPIEK